jgi:hypothetical protein
MPFINDEAQTSISSVGRALLRHHEVEWGVAAIVLVTLVVTSFAELAEAPLAVLARALSYVLPLVAGLLLANGLLRKLAVAQRFSEVVHHSATVIVGALFNEVLEWLLDIFRYGLVARIGWLTELVEALAYSAIFWSMCLLVRAISARSAGTQRREALPQAGLLGMLPDELRRDILWMKAEGNYVDVYGANDHRLVNYVFSRAAEELRSLGIQVHRSYWVARDNLIRVESGKGRIYAVLKGGHRVPVSRSFVREVRRAIDTRIPNE